MRPSPIATARARHSLADVAVRTGVELLRSTGSVTVRCPLPSHGHPDRTPSLRLHLDDGIFSCFGCGAKGDVVEWVRQTEGVDWREAIRLLEARRPLTNAWADNAMTAGERPRQDPGSPVATTRPATRSDAPDLARTPAERVYASLAAAWGYYTYAPLHNRGEDYLRSRGIDVRVLEAHTGRPEVGHTPAKADGLVSILRSKGFSDDELVDAGLAHRRPGGQPLSDFYRQRVLIPIRDDEGRIAGFIGRNIGGRGLFAKYKNPPHTHAYDKSVNLYQPLPAPAEPQGQVVVVEGTLDAMAIAVAAIRVGRAGRFCPVTQSGRELSALQLAQVIGLHHNSLVLGFDGDAAGRDSAYRHSLAAALRGRQAAVTVLPDQHDPASWLAEQGDDALAAWDQAGLPGTSREPPMPVPAATYVASYVTTQGRTSRTERTDAVVATDAHAERVTFQRAARRRQAAAQPAAAPVLTSDWSVPL
jgi:DNA primase